MGEFDFEIITSEDEIPVVCPKCQTSNPEGSNFCLNCGLALLRSRPNRANWLWLTVCVLIFAGVMVYFYQRLSKFESKKNIPQISKLEVPAPRKKSPVAVEAKRPVIKDQKIQTTSGKMKIPVGLAVIKDITGKVINEVPVAVLGGGWVALPKKLCLGGAEWTLRMGTETEVSIVAGLYNDYDRVGLWRILDEFRIDGPELYPWTAEEPSTWLAMRSTDSPEPLEITNTREAGYFIEAALAANINEPGVVFQNGRAVGWTFGESVAGAFVWNGDEGQYLRPEVRVDDFYRITFANSREEEFTRALGMGADYLELERLEALVNGFRFERKLSDEETPARLKKDTVIESMRALIQDSLKAGSAREVANLFEVQILAEAGDVELLMAVARATAQSYGFEDGIELTENVVEVLSPLQEQDSIQLAKFLSEYYQAWVVSLLNKGSLQAAWRAYRLGSRRLPDDPAVHLLGVQLALADNNWAEAEGLLEMKEYPPALNDKVQNLRNQISELKAQEGKIVINFIPGNRHIPVSALVNGSVDQNFIVDTGASMVTIPHSTAEYLGLAVDERNPRHKLITAGGVRYAPEVTLDSITIGGWEVTEVKAVVLDIPNQPDLGLLGLNYLENFRMDLNTEGGTLLLEPR
jgi:clan AA aspartic protease (TIGR02281 family)